MPSSIHTSAPPGLRFRVVAEPSGEILLPFLGGAGARTHGLTPIEVHRDVSALVSLSHPEDRTAFEVALRAAASAPGDWCGEVRLRCGDGAYRSHRIEARCDMVAGGRHELRGSITEAGRSRPLAAAAFAHLEERFELAQVSSDDVFWEADLVRDQLEWSDRLSVLLGDPPFEPTVTITEGLRLVHPEDRHRVERTFATVAASGGDTVRAQFRLVHANGRDVVVRSRASVLRDHHGRPQRLIGTLTDVTELRAAEGRLRESRARFERLLEFAPVALAIFERSGALVAVNRRFVEQLGYEATEIPSLAVWWERAYPDADYRAQVRASWRAMLDAGSANGERPTAEEHQLTIASGQVKTMLVSGASFGAGVITAFVDISPLKAAETAIQALAFLDPLTDLPNRRLAMDRLRQALLGARRERHYGALCFLDLDGFKALNDRCGHDAGDVYLRAIAHRLRARVRATDTVARLGGDEFIVVLPNLSDEPGTARSLARRLATQLREVFNQPVALERAGCREWRLTPSIGVAVFGPEDTDPEVVLRAADRAMYRAKRIGGDGIAMVTPSETT